MYSKTKAALVRQLAFSLTILGILVACEDPGSVGGGFVTESEVKVDTILIQNIETETVAPYLGQRTYSAIGKFADPLFGDIDAFTFFKPSITRNDTMLTSAVSLKMSLNLITSVYGDSSTAGTYSVFRVNEIWKGTSFTNDRDLTYGTEVIGQFNDADVDTLGNVLFELSGTWRDDYINFYNSDDSLRNSIYRDGDFGLAIVPDAGNNKIIYANMVNSRLMIEDDSVTTSNGILDWGFKTNKGADNAAPGRINIYNTYENYIKINLENVVANFDGKNFVRAELIFAEDTLTMNSTLNAAEVRTKSPGLVLKLGPVDDKAYSFGFTSITTNQNGLYDDGKYVFRLTETLTDNLFGDTEITEAYIFPYSNSGVLGFSSLYDVGAPEDLAPKLIVYTLDKGEQ